MLEPQKAKTSVPLAMQMLISCCESKGALIEMLRLTSLLPLETGLGGCGPDSSPFFAFGFFGDGRAGKLRSGSWDASGAVLAWSL